MLIYEEIQKLKKLNTELESSLTTLKEDTKGEVLEAHKEQIEQVAHQALQEAISQIKAYADEKIKQSTNDLEAFHAARVKMLFEAQIEALLQDFSVDNLSRKIALDFATQNAQNATNAIESIVLAHTSDFIKRAKDDISQATREALSATRTMLDTALELKNELSSQAGLNAIKKYRFECALHLSAICATSELKTLSLAYSAEDFPPRPREMQTNALLKD